MIRCRPLPARPFEVWCNAKRFGRYQTARQAERAARSYVIGHAAKLPLAIYHGDACLATVTITATGKAVTDLTPEGTIYL